MKKIIALTILLFCFVCSGCGFHMRSDSEFPDQLQTIYFSSTKPYGELSTQLNNLFHAMNIRVVKKQSAARFSILVSKNKFIYSRPDIVDTTLPTSINFVSFASVTILDNQNKKAVISNSFTATQSLTLNVNQIYTTNSNTLIKQQLNRKIAYLIYYWLTSS